MKFLKLLPFYIYWHYSKGITDLLSFSKNILWFVWNFFSIKTLVFNFFTPFERLKENYKGGLDVESFFSSLVVTTIMRLVGMFLRSFIIVAGLVSLIVSIVLLCALFFVWLVLPALVLILFVVALLAITKNM